ncbi:MAG TPA: hypothetical protein VK993_05340 [Chthoniobacterales bacterium]|nr:hypothetical protein [Chthoniobacterales bacterium]
MQVYAGDILFIAGCRFPVDRSQQLAFEHVAVAAENRTLGAAAEWLDLPVYSMPESRYYAAQGMLTGITVATGQYWQHEKFAKLIGVTIGSSETIWNLACREPSIDAEMGEYLAMELAQCDGSFDCEYQSVFEVEPALSGRLGTNCLGFTCSVMEHFGFNIVARAYPEYSNPYRSSGTKNRDFPSPGHVARALYANVQRPYTPADRQEADYYARADITLEAVAHPKRGCLPTFF